MSVLNKERNDCECVEYQDSTMWEKLNRSDVDGCVMKDVSYSCSFLRIECECVRYERYELIISILLTLKAIVKECS